LRCRNSFFAPQRAVREAIWRRFRGFEARRRRGRAEAAVADWTPAMGPIAKSLAASGAAIAVT